MILFSPSGWLLVRLRTHAGLHNPGNDERPDRIGWQVRLFGFLFFYLPSLFVPTVRDRSQRLSTTVRKTLGVTCDGWVMNECRWRCSSWDSEAAWGRGGATGRLFLLSWQNTSPLNHDWDLTAWFSGKLLRAHWEAWNKLTVALLPVLLYAVNQAFRKTGQLSLCEYYC